MYPSVGNLEYLPAAGFTIIPPMREVPLIMLASFLYAAAGLASPASPARTGTGETMRFVIDDMRLEAEALILEQGLRSWENRVYGDPVDIAQTYEGHGRLFSPEAVAAVTRAIGAAAEPRERKGLRYLRRHLLSEYIGKAVAPLDDRIRNTESGAETDVDGAKVPYPQLAVLLATEPDYAKRQRISDAALPVLKTIETDQVDKEKKSRALACALGFESYSALSEELRSFSLDALARDCEAILEKTEPAYTAFLGEVTRDFMGLPPEKFRRCDVARLFQLDRYGKYFPAAELMPAVSSTLEGMGIDLKGQRNILIHDAPLPKKNPRAACFALKVPADVRLTVKPTGGVPDYETLLHEMGHAQHFANTRTDRFEFAQLGDNTVTEAYAFLFEELMDDPGWVKEHTSLPPAELEAYLKFRRFSRIYFARRYAAKILYERELHSGTPDPKAIYRKMLSRAYGFPLDGNDAARYLSDVDDYYYAADYLRAWFLKAQLEAALRSKFGERWFSDPGAGALLKSLWAYGQELNGGELARHLGYAGLSPEPFIRKLTEGQARQ